MACDRWVAALCALLFAVSAAAQIAGTGSALSPAELAAVLRGASGIGGAMGLNLGAGVSGSLVIPAPQTTSLGESPSNPDAPKADRTDPRKPLPPNAFQQYVLETIGERLPLFGASFFEGLLNQNEQLSLAPAGDDYVVGPGDKLLVRVWGAASVEAPVTVDARGEVSFPKLGVLPLAGVRAGQLNAVVGQFFGRFFKNVEVSVAVARLRRITVYVVGQARQPGSYALSSQATLTSALFASGGPSSTGSVRRVQLRRQGQTVAEFDLYAFLGRGDKSADVKLLDGDVLFYPPAGGYVALHGQVNQAAVFELRGSDETLSDFMALAGGTSVVADPRRATLERMRPGVDQPREVRNLQLDAEGLRTRLANGDVLHVGRMLAEISNAVTLRGAVAQPGRVAWRTGMRASDVIQRKSLLITPETVRLQSEVLFDALAQERTARQRARVPDDLAAERALQDSGRGAGQPGQAAEGQAALSAQASAGATSQSPSAARPDAKGNDQALLLAQQGKPVLNEATALDRIGRLYEEINLDYAVVERFDREQLKSTVIPFNLGRMLAGAGGADDPLLQPGDVLTVFSAKDLRVPTGKRQAFVRVEGEVRHPGVYPLMPGENLQSLVAKAGGVTPEAYLYATALFREEVKASQIRNLDKLVRRMDAETSGLVAQASQSTGGSADAAALQAKTLSIQRAQQQALERLKSLKPEGRVALGLEARPDLSLQSLPALRLEDGDRISIPPRSDFVHVYGAINTESAQIFKPGLSVEDYLSQAGISVSSDLDAVVLVRADGSAVSNTRWWGNNVLSARVMPGDTIVIPEKFDRESAWSRVARGAKDFTQILYQLGLGAAAIKTLRE